MSFPTILDQEFAKATRFVAGYAAMAHEISVLAYQAAGEVCEEFGDQLDEYYEYIGHQLVELTEAQLGEEAAEFVIKALDVVKEVAIRTFYAAPITAVSLLAPTWVSAPLWIGYTIVHLAKDKPFSNMMYDNINTGMGNAFLIRAATSAGQFLTSGNPVHALSTLISLAIAGVWHGKVPATDDPEEPNKGGNLNSETPREYDHIDERNRVEDVTGQEEEHNHDNIDNANNNNDRTVFETGNEVFVGQQ